MRNKDARFGIDAGFAAMGAQRAATHGHFDPQPVWSSRFEQNAAPAQNKTMDP